jgi:hypothetical protein
MVLDALPVVLLAAIAGAGPVIHIRDTAAEHGQHRPTSQADARTSAKKERNTARPAPSVCRTTTEMSDQPAGEPTTRRSSRSSARSPSGQDLRWWAAALAAALPPLTEPQVAAVARLAAHLDADHSQKPAA